MKANELRIGNLVTWADEDDPNNSILTVPGILTVTGIYSNDGIWVEWEWTDGTNDRIYCGFDRIKPIPLTEERLVLFGFVDMGDGYFRKKESIDFVVDLEEKQVSWVDQKYNYKYCYHNVPKYVHELQNLYFVLAGEELTV